MWMLFGGCDILLIGCGAIERTVCFLVAFVDATAVERKFELAASFSW
jgi:hypothetical protein